MGYCTHHITLYILVVEIILPTVPAAPTLSVSPSSVVVGGSVTFTCTFLSAPLIAAEIRSSDGRYNCVLEAAGDDTCTGGTGLGCVGNSLACSADKKTYSLTVNSVPETWHGEKFLCRDVIINNDDSLEVQIMITVPPTNVSINPPGNIVSIEQGQTVNLTCFTDATRPQSNITWYRNNVLIPGATQTVISTTRDRFITYSVLTFSGDRSHQGALIRCTAGNQLGKSPVSSQTKSINVQYPPTGKPRFVDPVLAYNTSNIVILTCEITTTGNPPAAWTWTCGSTTFTSTDITSSGIQSTLTFIVGKANNEDQCRCRARSSIGSYDMSSDPVTLIVQYPPTGRPQFNNSFLTYNTGDVAELTCRLPSDGNPRVIWIWRCGTRVLTPNEVSNIKSQSTARFTVTRDDNEAKCTCQASSPVGPFNSVSDYAVINVQYPPIRGLEPSTESVTVLRHDEDINLLAYFMGNPRPSIQWYLRSNSSTSLTNLKNESATLIIVQKDGNNSYMSIVKQYDPAASDFGEYVLLIQNHLGILIFQFLVFTEDIPCAPANVSIDCSMTNIAILSWSTGCIGRTSKSDVTYNILAKKPHQANFTIHEPAKILIGKSGQSTATLNQSSGEWIFKIQAKNRLGSTKSKDISCHITSHGSMQKSQILDGKSVGVGVGITIGFVCCLGGAAYLALKLRKRSAETPHDDSEDYHREPQSPYDVIPAEMQDSRAYSELNMATYVDREMKVYENTAINNT